MCLSVTVTAVSGKSLCRASPIQCSLLVQFQSFGWNSQFIFICRKLLLFTYFRFLCDFFVCFGIFIYLSSLFFFFAWFLLFAFLQPLNHSLICEICGRNATSPVLITGVLSSSPSRLRIPLHLPHNTPATKASCK